jgi:hypothetical protein
LEGFLEDVKKAQGMISTFEDTAVSIQERIDALVPTPERAAERAGTQNALAGDFIERLAMDRELDSALESAKRILKDRSELTAKMRKLAECLEFPPGLDLDGERFDALLRSLPKEVAQTSGKFINWFLGREPDRHPRTITCDEITLPETLRSANVFFYGDQAELTAEEARAIDALDESRHVPMPMEMESATVVPGQGAKELPIGKIQWGLMR